METFDILQITKDGIEEKRDAVTEEIPLTIEVNGEEIATLLASPGDLKDLVIGFLFTAGLIRDAASVRAVTIDEQRWKADVITTDQGIGPDLAFKRIYTSGCGRGVVFSTSLDLINRVKLPSGFTIQAASIIALMKTLLTGSQEHRATGGVHSAALADGNALWIFMDDIGRHNAVDKAVGRALSDRIVFSQTVLLTSGRISSEILGKVLACRIPIIVSAGAPTNQAVKLARETNVTLVAHVRGTRMNVYSGLDRVKTDAPRAVDAVSGGIDDLG
jgi:FdhD protein